MIFLLKININKFGEAYSGDSPNSWRNGKKSMEKTIDDNLQFCKNSINLNL